MHKRKAIDLRTDLGNQSITQALRDSCLKPTEIVTNTKKKKASLKDKLLRRNTVAFTGPIDFNQFDSISINENSPNSSMNIQGLLNENYSFYIDKLRTIYPFFRFNHYSKYFEQVRLIKRDQQHIRPKELEKSVAEKNEITSINKTFQCQQAEYRIDSAVLEQKKEELELSVKAFDAQIEGIELELGHVLKGCGFIESYIESNLFLREAIEGALAKLRSRQEAKEAFRKNWLENASKLMIAMIRKRNKVTALSLMKRMTQISCLLDAIKQSNGTNSVNEVNALSDLKSKINSLRKVKELKCLIDIEREMQKFNDQSEVRHIEQFILIISTVIHRCFNFTTGSESIKPMMNGDSREKLEVTFDLTSIQTHSSHHINASKQLTFYYLILLPSKTQLLNEILLVFSIIITQNYEIPMIIDRLKAVFLKEISSINDQLKQILSNIEHIAHLAKAYFILIQNYNYLLELFNNNFAFSPKNFTELTKYIKTETKGRLFPLVNAMVIEIVALGDIEQLQFAKEKVNGMIGEYLEAIAMPFDKYYAQYENDFIFQFFQLQIGRIKEGIAKEQWVQVPKIASHYQKLIEVLLIDFHLISKEELYSVPPFSSTIQASEDIAFILIRESKLIAMSSTLILIEFFFATYKLLFYLHHNYSQAIILQLCKWITYSLNQTQATIINSKGEVNNKKITEREFMLVNATAVILKHIFFAFITYFLGNGDNAINETINSVLKKISEIHQSCVESMKEVTSQAIHETIKEFSGLNFKEYPLLPEKTYNVYIMKYCRLKKIYDLMLMSFEVEDAVALYQRVFPELIEQMTKVVNSKPKIENDAMLKQFRGEMFYMKKLLEMFELIDTAEYAKALDGLSLAVNPNKKPKKKKKDKEQSQLKVKSLETSETLEQRSNEMK